MQEPKIQDEPVEPADVADPEDEAQQPCPPVSFPPDDVGNGKLQNLYGLYWLSKS